MREDGQCRAETSSWNKQVEGSKLAEIQNLVLNMKADAKKRHLGMILRFSECAAFVCTLFQNRNEVAIGTI